LAFWRTETRGRVWKSNLFAYSISIAVFNLYHAPLMFQLYFKFHSGKVVMEMAFLPLVLWSGSMTRSFCYTEL
jgi:cytochrome c oxidase assembly factor CtaG